MADADRTHSPSSHGDALPQPAPDVMCERFDDGAVLFSTGTELYFGLNHVGATVWELLPLAGSLEELCDEVGRRHAGADAGMVRRDVWALLDDLLGQKLILPVGSDAPQSPPAA